MDWLMLRKRATLNEDGDKVLAGVELMKEAPPTAEFSDGYVAQGMSEGWVELDESKLVVDDKGWWMHAKAIVLHLIGGDVRYAVSENPGLHMDNSAPGGYRVEHRYACKLEEVED